MKIKEKKDIIICAICQREIKPTAKWYRLDDGTLSVTCFKCHQTSERELREEKEREKAMEIVNRIRRKKYLCQKCVLRKNDNEVHFFMVGIFCCKCGSKVIEIIKDIYKDIDIDNC